MLTLSHESRRDLPQTHAHAPRVEYAREQASFEHQQTGYSNRGSVPAIARLGIMLSMLSSIALVDGQCTWHEKGPEPCSCTHHMPRGNTMSPGNGTADLAALSDERANPWAQPLFARPAAVVPEEPSHPFCTCQGRHHLHRSAETDQRRADGPAFLCTYDLLARRFPAIPTATSQVAILATDP